MPTFSELEEIAVEAAVAGARLVRASAGDLGTVTAKSTPSDPVTIEISSLDGSFSVSHEVEAHAGLNRWFWDLRFEASQAEIDAYQDRMAEMRERMGGQIPAGFRTRGPQGSEAVAGTYRVRISAGARRVEGTLTLREDPGIEGVLPSVRE